MENEFECLYSPERHLIAEPSGTKSKFTFDRSFIPDPLFLPLTPLSAVTTLLKGGGPRQIFLEDQI